MIETGAQFPIGPKTSKTLKKQGKGHLFSASGSSFPWENRTFPCLHKAGNLAGCIKKPSKSLKKQQVPLG
jgi:hypothetical protein